MTKPNKTEIVFVVDRSGSMSSIAAAMGQGFDEFINKQKQVAGECLVTAVQFDDQYETLYTARPLDQVPAYVLQPRGTTALLDAIGKTIDTTGERLRQTPEGERPSQVLVVIITDGGENSSREYHGDVGRKAIFDKISHQRSKYRWEFVFLGANQDAIAVGTSLGISGGNAVTYAANQAGSQNLMRGLSMNVAAYRSSGQATMDNLYGQADYDAQAIAQPALLTPFGLGGMVTPAANLKVSVDAAGVVLPDGTTITVGPPKV